MSELSDINITIDLDTFQSVHLMAEKNNMQVDRFISQILKNYLEENIPVGPGVSEKRKFRRKKTIIPALVYKTTPNKKIGRYISTTILDISIGGTKLAFPIETESRVEFIRSNSEFEIILHLSDSETLARFKCQLKHVKENSHIQSIGASFLECDQFTHEQLNKYLSQ